MAIYKQNIVDIELNNGNIHRSFLAHTIGTADSKADRFGIRVFRNGEAVNLSEVSVQGYFRDPHGNNIAITSGNGKSENVAWVTLPQACYNYDGQFCLAIKLVGDGVTGTMRIVDGVVDNTNTGSAVAPTGTVPTYQEILAVYDQMVAAKSGSVRFDTAQDINQAGRLTARENIRAASYMMLAPVFSEDSTYEVGYYVINEQNIYRCKVPVTTPGPWTGTTNWEKVWLAIKTEEEISEINAALNSGFTEVNTILKESLFALGSAESNIVGDEYFNFTIGGMYGTNGLINTSAKYAYTDKKPVIPGSKVVIPNIGQNYIVSVVTYTDKKVFIERIDGSNMSTGNTITLDSNVYYIAFNFGLPGSSQSNMSQSDVDKFHIQVRNDKIVKGTTKYDNALAVGFVNDGTTDNSTAMNKYISAHQNGFKLYFPKGVYSFSSSIIFDHLNNWEISGEGTIKLASGTFTGTANDNTYFVKIWYCNNVKIDGITFDYNGDNNLIYYGTSYTADTVNIGGCEDVVVKNVKILNSIDSGIVVTVCKRVIVENNTMSLSTISFGDVTTAFNGNDVTITLPTAPTIQLKGRYFYLYHSTKAYSGIITDVSSNVLTGHILNSFGNKIPSEGTKLRIFKGDAGIYLNQSVDSDYIVAKGNMISGYTMGLHCNRGISNLRIESNVVDECIFGMDVTTYNQEGAYVHANPQNNIITGNRFDVYCVGIGSLKPENLVISNNIIICNVRGIAIYAGDKVSITGNTITGIKLQNEEYVAILFGRGRKDGVLYGSNNSLAVGNVIHGWYKAITVSPLPTPEQGEEQEEQVITIMANNITDVTIPQEG